MSKILTNQKENDICLSGDIQLLERYGLDELVQREYSAVVSRLEQAGIVVMPLEFRARAFAKHHHAAIGQTRKYTGEPYINHPAAVAELVRSVPHTPEMIAAAWLHDTVEDTPVTLADIHREFGPQVASLVEMLTDVSQPTDGNRKARKEIDRQHTAKASPEGKTIKLADLIDNSRSIFEHDPGFAKIYLAEKEALLEVLREGDTTLWDMASENVNLQKEKNK